MYWSLAIAVCLIGQISGFTVVQETATPSFLDMLTTEQPMQPTTGPQHNANDSNEFDQALFYFDGPTHQLVMKLGHHCYIHGITSSQHGLIHTADGLLNFESILMYLVAAGMHIPMTHEDTKSLSPGVEHFCAGYDIFTLKRIHASTTARPIV